MAESKLLRKAFITTMIQKRGDPNRRRRNGSQPTRLRRVLERAQEHLEFGARLAQSSKGFHGRSKTVSASRFKLLQSVTYFS
jgi:hypothetical protein